MIRITKHAIDKYKQIIGRKTVDPEGEIIDLFSGAVEEKLIVKRVIDNPVENTKYFRNGDFRFVIVDDNMVTLETNTFDYTGLGIAKHEKKRSKKEWKWKKRNR